MTEKVDTDCFILLINTEAVVIVSKSYITRY